MHSFSTRSSCCQLSAATGSTYDSYMQPHVHVSSACLNHSSRRLVAAAAGRGNATAGPGHLDDSSWGELAPNTVSHGAATGNRRGSRHARGDSRDSNRSKPGTQDGWYGDVGPSWYGDTRPSSSRGTSRDDVNNSRSRSRDRDRGSSQGGVSFQHGDWTCPDCGNHNFARRSSCRQCDAPRPAAGVRPSSSERMQPGDWICPDCGNHNFARRTSCHTCSAPRPLETSSLSNSSSNPRTSSSSSSPEGSTAFPGDWACPDCGEVNFSSYNSCRMCDGPKPADRGSFRPLSNQQQQPGDWICPDCGNLNFARRSYCRQCDTPRPTAASSSSSRPGPFSDFRQQQQQQPGDWTCPKCGDLNFARRTSCRQCATPRPAAAASSSRSKDKPEVKKKKASSLVAKDVACCYGCGAPLQTEVPAAAGYVSPDKFELKKKHRQLKQVLCARCTELCNGAMIPAVEDFTQKAWAEQQQQLLATQPTKQQQQQAAGQSTVSMQQQLQEEEAGLSNAQLAEAVSAAAHIPDNAADGFADVGIEQLELMGKVLVTPEQLRQKISEVRSVKVLVVMLVDLLDASGTLMGKVRDMVGNNPIVLVGTKMDLLPAGCAPKDVATWLAEAAARKRLQVTSAHLVSSHSGEGVAAVASKIARERKGRDVFVVGAANVGKSAFIRALLKEMSSLSGGNFDAAAAATSRYLPVESAMPGTTLGIIPLQAFETGGTLYDTPGVHLHHRVPHMLTPAELKLLHPRRRLLPFVPSTPLEVMTEADDGGDEEDALPGPSRGRSKPKSVSASYLWSGLVRIDVLSGPPSTSLVFNGPSTMRIYALPLLAEGQEVDFDLEDETAADSSDSDDDGPSSEPAEAVASSSSKQKVLICSESVAARGGLVPHTLRIPVLAMGSSGCLADVAVSGLPGWVAVYAPFAKNEVTLRVWVPRGVEVFLRPPLPCPQPAKPLAAADGEGSAADMADIGDALDMKEADQDWELHREQLGLRPMTAEDEEVIKMLLYGSEAQGLTGIMDMELEEEGVEEDDAAPDDEELTTAAAVPSAESLVATVADAVVPKRGKVAKSRRGSAAEDSDAAPVAGPVRTRRRRQQV